MNELEWLEWLNWNKQEWLEWLNLSEEIKKIQNIKDRSIKEKNDDGKQY